MHQCMFMTMINGLLVCTNVFVQLYKRSNCDWNECVKNNTWSEVREHHKNLLIVLSCNESQSKITSSYSNQIGGFQFVTSQMQMHAANSTNIMNHILLVGATRQQMLTIYNSICSEGGSQPQKSTCHRIHIFPQSDTDGDTFHATGRQGMLAINMAVHLLTHRLRNPL